MFIKLPTGAEAEIVTLNACCELPPAAIFPRLQVTVLVKELYEHTVSASTKLTFRGRTSVIRTELVTAFPVFA